MKSSWQSSPGEIKPSQLLSFKLTRREITDMTDSSSPSKECETKEVLSMPKLVLPPNDSGQHQEDFLRYGPGTSDGPNICPASEFQASLSPIKCPDGVQHSPTKESFTDPVKDIGSSVLDDSHTRKLLTFMQQLERSRKSNQTTAQQLHELSALLKNSSGNVGRSDDRTLASMQDAKRSVTSVESDVSKNAGRACLKRNDNAHDVKAKKAGNINKMAAKSNKTAKKQSKHAAAAQKRSSDAVGKGGAAKVVQVVIFYFFCVKTSGLVAYRVPVLLSFS